MRLVVLQHFTELKRHIVRFGLAEVRAELTDHVGPRGVGILEYFDPQPRLVKVVGQIAVKMIDVVDAAGQLANGWRIVIDSNQQCIDVA